MLFIKYIKYNCDISDTNPINGFVSSLRQLCNIDKAIKFAQMTCQSFHWKESVGFWSLCVRV